MTHLRGLALAGAWSPAEVRVIAAALRALPPQWVEENPAIRQLERRGRMVGGPASAPGHSMYEPRSKSIIIFDKGASGDERLARSLYHELAHTLLRTTPGLLERWSAETSGDHRYVDRYAKRSPEEDFCDTFSEHILFPDLTRKATPGKSRFLDRLAGTTTEKTAMSFIDGFIDELEKTGGAKESIGRELAERLRGKGPQIARLALAGGAAGYIGNKLGRRQGEEDAAAGSGEAVQNAYQAGAMAMRDAMEQGLPPGA